jgi:hypothetical protein
MTDIKIIVMFHCILLVGGTNALKEAIASIFRVDVKLVGR